MKGLILIVMSIPFLMWGMNSYSEDSVSVNLCNKSNKEDFKDASAVDLNLYYYYSDEKDSVGAGKCAEIKVPKGFTLFFNFKNCITLGYDYNTLIDNMNENKNVEINGVYSKVKVGDSDYDYYEDFGIDVTYDQKAQCMLQKHPN